MLKKLNFSSIMKKIHTSACKKHKSLTTSWKRYLSTWDMWQSGDGPISYLSRWNLFPSDVQVPRRSLPGVHGPKNTAQPEQCPGRRRTGSGHACKNRKWHSNFHAQEEPLRQFQSPQATEAAENRKCNRMYLVKVVFGVGGGVRATGLKRFQWAHVE